MAMLKLDESGVVLPHRPVTVTMLVQYPYMGTVALTLMVMVFVSQGNAELCSMAA